MGLDRLEKLTKSVEALKDRYLSLKAERDMYSEDAEALGMAEEKVKLLEAEREVMRDKLDALIESIDALTTGGRS